MTESTLVAARERPLDWRPAAIRIAERGGVAVALRGTPLGFPVPTIKISSNSDIAAKRPHWIDFNAGALVEGMTESRCR